MPLSLPLSLAALQSTIARNLLTIAPTATVQAAIAQMAATGSSAVWVVASGDMPPQESDVIGVLTARDIVRISAQSPALDQLSIQSVMSQPVISLKAADFFTDPSVALDLFQRHQIRHLPVLDQSDRVVGVLTHAALTERFARYFLGSSIPLDEPVAPAALNDPAALWQLNQELEQRVAARTAALKASEERWQHVLKGSNDGIWDWDITTNKIFFSSRWKQMRGFADDEIGDTPDECSSRIHPDDYARIMAAANDHLTGKTEFFEMEYRALCKDGSYLWVLERGQALRDASGEAIRISGTLTDISDRKQAELENQRLKERLQFVLSSSPAVIFTCKPEGDYGATFISDNIYDVTGYTAAEFLAESSFWADRLHPEDAPQILAEFPQLLEREYYVHEYRFRHQAGHYRWMQDELRLVRNAQGTPIEIVGCCVDISDRKQAEQELRQSRDLREAIFEESADALFVVDPQTLLILDCNQRAVQLFAVADKSELIGIQGHTLQLRAFSPEELVEIMADTQSNGFWSREIEYVSRQGQVFWGNIAAVPIAVAGITRHLVRVTDISDRKRAEETIRQQSDRERLLHAMAQRIRQTLDLDAILATAVTDVLQTFQADRALIFRLCPDHSSLVIQETVRGNYPRSLDRTWTEATFDPDCYAFYHGGQPRIVPDVMADIWTDCLQDFMQAMQVKSKMIAPILQTRDDHTSFIWGLLVVHACGTPRQWQLAEAEFLQQIASQLAIAIQQANLFEQLQQELTERQQTQQQLTERNYQLAISNSELAQATRLKDEFLTNMSHELRTPLNAILGMAQALQEHIFGTTNERQLRACQLIETSGNHLLELINDILDLAKIGAGQIELECAPTSSSQLCQSSLVFVKQQACQKNIQFEVRQQFNLPDLLVDERRIRQVLINLLNNAVKFTPTGGRITLDISQQPNPESPQARTWIQFSVIDTGIGIAPENIHKLFQPFIQIDSALNRQYDGTGLGLSLVKRIVELHGGRVGLTSEVGVGSCFTIALPCVDRLSATATPSTPAAPRPHLSLAESGVSPLILLAEDNAASSLTFSSYLKAKGYRLRLAQDGQAAIDLAKAHPPDLILMDIQMPGLNGLEAIRQMRLTPNLIDTPIIALTALAMAGDRDRCLAAGATAYLAKPVSLQKLAHTMQQLLAAKPTTERSSGRSDSS